jgi:hypothetical protein
MVVDDFCILFICIKKIKLPQELSKLSDICNNPRRTRVNIKNMVRPKNEISFKCSVGSIHGNPGTLGTFERCKYCGLFENDCPCGCIKLELRTPY